jgi:hypothetical protein
MDSKREERQNARRADPKANTSPNRQPQKKNDSRRQATRRTATAMEEKHPRGLGGAGTPARKVTSTRTGTRQRRHAGEQGDLQLFLLNLDSFVLT